MKNASAELMVGLEKQDRGRGWPAYNTIWRWHFYAGLFCIPFILVLTITGAIYLFNPQVEEFLDRPYANLALTGKHGSASAQVDAALAAVPGTVLNAYVLPTDERAAVQVLVGREAEVFRVYVHPETLEILKSTREDWRLMRVVHRLHGELLLGDRGSMIVELAASWAIVMFITGLYLWWPKNAKGLGGILYPRWGRGKQMLWRDLHAVTGLWIAFFTLFLLISGLPWAKSWGGMLKEIRHWSAGAEIQQDWTTGRSSVLAERRDMNAHVSEHAEHEAHHGSMAQGEYGLLDHLAVSAQTLHLASPVLISPPSRKSPDWMVQSKAQNRPLRADVVFDGVTGEIKSRKDFADRLLLDRFIGIGVAAHEGQLFGWWNQALGVFTAVGLLALSASGIVLWLRRRSPGEIGAPKAGPTPARFAFGLIAIIVMLSLLLPLLGLTLILVLSVERWLLVRIPSARTYLGLNAVTR